jgi:hypothetical protein
MENVRRFFHPRAKDPAPDGPTAALRGKTFPSGIKLLHHAQHSAVEYVGFAMQQACLLNTLTLDWSKKVCLLAVSTSQYHLRTWSHRRPRKDMDGKAYECAMASNITTGRSPKCPSPYIRIRCICCRLARHGVEEYDWKSFHEPANSRCDVPGER